MKLWKGQGIVLILALISPLNTLSYDPSDYLEVYPDPMDPEVLKGRTPLYFALIQSLGRSPSQSDGGSVAGVKVALDRINNDSSLLPGYTLHYTFTDSACNRSVSLDALHYQLFNEPRKIAIIGSGCSVATEPTAEISHYYNITQISCASLTPLNDRVRFPRHFQLLSTSQQLALGFYGIIREYGWRKISLIVQEESLFTETMGHLKDLLIADDIEFNETIFSTRSGIGSDIFDMNFRIFLLSMYESHARRLLCEAYNQQVYQPRSLLLTIGWYSRHWWRVEQPGLTCTVAQRERVLLSTLAVTDTTFLNAKRAANLQTTSGITGDEFLSEERKFLQQPPLNISFSHLSQYCHDATWTLAYALNSTISSLEDTMTNEKIADSFNLIPPFSIEEFSYSSHELLEVIFRHLKNTSFDGITGPVRFGAEGVGEFHNLIALQYRTINATSSMANLDIVEIGTVDPETLTFSYTAGEDFTTTWTDFGLPYDGVPFKRFATLNSAVIAVFAILAFAGLILVIICLVFNFKYRKTKLIKLASFKLNCLLGLGAALTYMNVAFFLISSTDYDVINIASCNTRVWLGAIGYSLSYGTMIIKMVRVYYIFKGSVFRKKTVQEDTLVLAVACFAGIDLVILVTFTVVEGIKGSPFASEAVHREEPTEIGLGPQEIITENFIYICTATATKILLVIIYSYKVIQLVAGLVLAFATRKVKVKGLDDAKYSAAAIYISTILLAVAILVSSLVSLVTEFINLFAATFSILFLATATIPLLFLYVPLMIAMYKDPQGETIFPKLPEATNTPWVIKETLLKPSNQRYLRKGIRQQYVNEEEDVESLMQKLLEALIKEHDIKARAGLSLESCEPINQLIVTEKTLSGTTDENGTLAVVKE